MRAIRLSLIFVFLFCIMSFAPASAFGLNVEKKVLQNGLTVLHVKRTNLPMVTFTLLVRGGQRNEPADRAGLANLTADLMTEGTSKRSSIQISKETDFIGASLNVNARDDYSTVNLSVLKKHLDTGFELFSDVLLHPSFPEEEIERQKAQILAALKRNQEDPDYVAHTAFIKAVYSDHPYGHPRLGTPEGIGYITRDDITGFYETHYVPGGSILAVVGDITLDETERLITAYLGGWEGSAPEKNTLPPPPSPEKRTVSFDRQITQANIYLGHLGVKRTHPDYYTLSIMNYILGGGGFSSRLMASIRDEMGLAYSVYSTMRPGLDTGAFYSNVQTKNASANTVIEEILNQMRRISTEPVSDQELADAKSYFIGSFPRRIETMKRTSSFLCAVEFYGLGLDYPEKYTGYIESVTKEDILKAAAKYLHPDNYTLVVVGNLKEAGLKEKY